MTIQESKIRLASNPDALEAVETLLERYPDIDNAEMRQIANYLKHAPSLDVGLLSSNKSAWKAQEQLKVDRPDLFRTTARGWAVGVVIAIVTGLMLYWLATFADA